MNLEGQAAPECGGIVVNRVNPRVFFDNLEFRYAAFRAVHLPYTGVFLAVVKVVADDCKHRRASATRRLVHV